MDFEVALLIRSWDWSYIDAKDALEGIEPTHLHLRPHPNLIAISEHVAHLMRSEASIICRYLLGQKESEWGDRFFVMPPYGWPPDILNQPVDPRLTEMTTETIWTVWQDHHKQMIDFAQQISMPSDHRFEDDWALAAPDIASRLRFAGYHVAYHVGQIYQLRHLLGESTPDN